jgi:ABC-2 type transport system permease protein
MILFGMPVVMMLLFGFAISTDIRNVRTVVVTSSMDDITARMVEKIDASEYFTVTKTVTNTDDAKLLMRDQKADMAIVFAPNFANHQYDGSASVQVIADATDPNTALMETNYARQIIISAIPRSITRSTSSRDMVCLRMLYNPQMLSAFNFVPGIMGMLLMIICAMMTSVSIVQEKETGTMEVLLVSPVKPVVIIIAKAIPYLVLSILILVCVLLLSAFVLNVPIAGSLSWIVAVSILYLLLSLSLGLLISTVAEKQIVALLASGLILLLPSILLSGMVYPIESMPSVLQYISAIVPARWYISAMRKLMIMGVGFSAISREVTILFAMTAVLLTISLKMFKTRLE